MSEQDDLDEALKNRAKDEDIIQLQETISDLNDSILLTAADMANREKRNALNNIRSIALANQKMLKNLFSMMDGIEMGIRQYEGKNDEGLILIQKQLLDIFENFNVKTINPIDEQFDPNYHEAIFTRDDSDVESNTVIEVIYKGYLLNDLLLRPASVVVAS